MFTGFHLVPVTITNIPHDRKPFYMACPHEVADVTGMQMQDVTGKNRNFHHDGISLKWSWCHFSVPYFFNATHEVSYRVFFLVSRSQFQILRAEVKMAQNQRISHEDCLLVPADIKNWPASSYVSMSYLTRMNPREDTFGVRILWFWYYLSQQSPFAMFGLFSNASRRREALVPAIRRWSLTEIFGNVLLDMNQVIPWHAGCVNSLLVITQAANTLQVSMRFLGKNLPQRPHKVKYDKNNPLFGDASLTNSQWVLDFVGNWNSRKGKISTY